MVVQDRCNRPVVRVGIDGRPTVLGAQFGREADEAVGGAHDGRSVAPARPVLGHLLVDKEALDMGAGRCHYGIAG